MDKPDKQLLNDSMTVIFSHLMRSILDVICFDYNDDGLHTRADFLAFVIDNRKYFFKRFVENHKSVATEFEKIVRNLEIPKDER